MTTPDHDVVIVGAGFGGIGAGIEFKRLGFTDICILEREDGLGGTWHVNRYPGLAVDIPSVTYSYSFEPNPRWSRLFAPGTELKKYACSVADKYDLKRHMVFNTAVTVARWIDDKQLWEVSTDDGTVRTARYLVTATGFLSQPHTPDFPGMDDFAGRIIHTTAWPRDAASGADLVGRKVAVIGTGATAVQLIPEIADLTQHLTVFQRTPIWVVPKPELPIPRGLQETFARVPLTQKAARLASSSLLELLMVTGVLHFTQFRVGNYGAAWLAKAHLRRQVRDGQTRRKLTPDYDFGCKRPTFSNSYFPVFNRPDVALETDPIARFTPAGIVTESGTEHRIDTLVLATGFDLWDTNFPAIEVLGRDGVDLGKSWRAKRFAAYEGITVPGFPNFLSLNSPYSYSGLSYFTTIEGQMKHIHRLLGELARRQKTVFEVTADANERFLNEVTRRLDSSVFYRGDCSRARSYYFNKAGEAALLRPKSTPGTLREMASFPLDDYRYR